MSLRKRIDQDLKAGRLWKARDWEAAEAAFYERYGRKPGMVTAALKVRASIDRFPPEVQQRLRDLQRRLRLEGRYWEPRVSDPARDESGSACATGSLEPDSHSSHCF